MRVYEVGEGENAVRLDKYLKKLLREAPDGFIYKMLRKKNITLNGGRAGGGERLSEGDEVRLFLSEETIAKFSGEAESGDAFEKLRSLPYADAFPSGEFPVLYEDADVILINKPPGMLSQKAAPSDVSANEFIMSYLIDKGELEKERFMTFRPSVCNRLDRNTSGILIAGKTPAGLKRMSDAMKSRAIKKYYSCLVSGEADGPARLEGWLVKDESKNVSRVLQDEPKGKASGDFNARQIITAYRPVASGGGHSELEVELVTGRPHQIRCHLASAGHPVLGDYKYGSRGENEWLKREAGISRQMLCCSRVVLEDGTKVEAAPDAEYLKARRLLGLSR